MSETRSFQKPMAYNPSLAERPYADQPTQLERYQKMKEFGFDELDVADIEDKCEQLTEQLQTAQKEAAELKAALEEAQAAEARASLKLQSFQQVNRSQSTLARAELQKTRRRLAHTQAIASRLREQAEWLQANSPALVLPSHLQTFPTEDETAQENAELAQMQQRWEQDIAQLYEEAKAEAAANAQSAGRASEKASSGELEAARQRIELLESGLKKMKKKLDHAEREREASASPTAPSPSSTISTALTTGSDAPPGGEDATALRKELEASEEKCKEQMKKLKQLASAYKKLDGEKAELEAKLEASKSAAATARPEVSAHVVQNVQAALAQSRKQVAELRSSVALDLKEQLPRALEEILKSKAAEIQKLISSGAEEWKARYAVECEKRRKLHNTLQELRGNIRVYCRVRPMTSAESEHGSCISFPSPDEIQIKNESQGLKKTWEFNEIYKEAATQENVFAGIRDLVVSMIDGYNVCIFAYGQTGSGKTHSMQGTRDNPGIYPRTFNELFKVARERVGWKIELKAALVEIYNEEIRDLLLAPDDKRPKLQVRQGKEGNFVQGLTLQPVNCPEDVDSLLTTGQENRTVAATDMNVHSSRSHLLVQIFGAITTQEGKQLSSCITLVDLAGSERLAKSGVSGDRAKEAIAINKSLSALGDVINARATKSQHTPFRNSTLTHLLQDSLSGDSKTLMLLQINPCADHVEESLCSLQFGARVNAVEMKK